MAPALQEISVIAMVCQYSRVSGLFMWRLPLALMSSASKVPIGCRREFGFLLFSELIGFLVGTLLGQHRIDYWRGLPWLRVCDLGTNLGTLLSGARSDFFDMFLRRRRR